MGVISPVGNDVNTFWSNLCDGVCGIEAIKAFPTDNLPVGIAGIIKGFKAGANDFVTKPIIMDKLIKAIEKQLVTEE